MGEVQIIAIDTPQIGPLRVTRVWGGVVNSAATLVPTPPASATTARRARSTYRMEHRRPSLAQVVVLLSRHPRILRSVKSKGGIRTA